MEDLNRALSLIRTHAPDLRSLLSAWSSLGTFPTHESAHPVLREYLDAHVPNWSTRGQYSMGYCAGCERLVVRPARPARLHEISSKIKTAVVPFGTWTTLDRAPKSMAHTTSARDPTWTKRREQRNAGRDVYGSLLVHPRSLVWSTEFEDCGCCGASGKPFNWRCCCGQVIATVHTDCCGDHYALLDPRGVQWVSGLNELTSREKRVLHALRKARKTERKWLERSQFFAFHPSLDIAVGQATGRREMVRSNRLSIHDSRVRTSLYREDDFCFDDQGIEVVYDKHGVRRVRVRWVRKTKRGFFQVEREGNVSLEYPNMSRRVQWSLGEQDIRSAFDVVLQPFVREDLEELVRSFVCRPSYNFDIEQTLWLRALLPPKTCSLDEGEGDFL